MFDPLQPAIAVALVSNASGDLKRAWNAKWGFFTLPMTKIDKMLPTETQSESTVRPAAAEFADYVSAALYVSADKLRSGEYQPVSGSVKDILTHCVEWGWVA